MKRSDFENDTEFMANIDMVDTDELFKQLEYYGVDGYYANLWSCVLQELKKRVRPTGEWIPIKTRELTEEEKEEYPDYTFMYDCKLPEDGEEVLVTTCSGMVTLDTFYRDDGYGCWFECYCDDGDVVAWQPKPESYKKEIEE